MSDVKTVEEFHEEVKQMALQVQAESGIVIKDVNIVWIDMVDGKSVFAGIESRSKSV